MGNKRIWTLGVVLALFCAGALGVAFAGSSTLADEPPSDTEGHDLAVADLYISPTVEGEEIVVNATVENEGTETAEEVVELSVPGIGTNSTAVDLGPDQSTEVELTLETEIEDTLGSPYPATLSAGNASASGEAIVHLPPITGDDPPQDLWGDGEYEDIDGSGAFDIFDVQILFSNIDSPAVTEHSWAYTFQDGPEVNIFDVQTLFSKLGQDPPDPGFFHVTLTTVPDQVQDGEDIAVEYTVENTDDEAGTSDIQFLVDGTEEEVLTDQSLDPGQTVSDTFTYTTTDGDGGQSLPVTVATKDHEASTDVDVLGPANFDVELTDVPDTVDQGEAIAVEYTVQNTGDETATQDISFLVDGSQEDDLPNQQLDPGDSLSDSFTYSTDEADGGETLTVAVSTEDDEASADVPVLSPAFFDVDITDVPDQVAQGEDIVVEYAVENTGQQTDTQDITFLVDNQEEDVTADQTLEGGATLSDSFSYTTGAEDVDETLTVVVGTDDDDATADVTVAGVAEFEVEITDAPDAVRETEDVEVAFTVENTGGATASQDIEFLVDGNQEDVLSDQEINAGESLQDTFVYTTGSDQAGESVVVAVSTDDDSDEREVHIDDTELVATLGEETGSVGETVTVGIEVSSALETEQPVDAYLLAIQFDTDVLELQDVGGGAFGDPFDWNEDDGVVQPIDTGNDATTPLEPMIELEFEIVGTGESPLEFVFDEDRDWVNELNDPDGYTYATLFQSGTVAGE